MAESVKILLTAREGNVFRSICLFRGGGWSASILLQASHIPSTLSTLQTPPLDLFKADGWHSAERPSCCNCYACYAVFQTRSLKLRKCRCSVTIQQKYYFLIKTQTSATGSFTRSQINNRNFFCENNFKTE